MGRVGVGDNVTDPRPTYVTVAARNDRTIPAGGSTTMTVQIRDRYNNPVPGATVHSSTPNDGTIQYPYGNTTDGDGEVTVEYVAPESVPGDTPVSAFVGINDTDDWGSVPNYRFASLDLEVTNTSASTGTGTGIGGTTNQSSHVRATNANTFWGGDGVTFDLVNDGENMSTITHVGVVSAEGRGSKTADVIQEGNRGSGVGQHELYVESPTGLGHYDAGDSGESYGIGSANAKGLTSDVPIESGDVASVSLYAFKTDDGQSVPMQDGGTATVYVGYSDGSHRTYTLNF